MISAYRTPISTALPFDLETLKLFLRVDHDDENDLITRIGQTAAAELEHFAQIALLTQTVTAHTGGPAEALRLPIGPAVLTEDITVTANGEAVTGFTVYGGHRPFLVFDAPQLEAVRIKIEYTAGFGATAAAIPADLAQAMADQAALHYDARSPTTGKALTTSPHMARIGARYRGVRV